MRSSRLFSIVRTARIACLLALPTACAFAAEEGGNGEGGDLTVWKWANFLLLAVAIGYFIGKNAPAFFAARSKAISKDIAESQQIRQDAEERAAAVDRRLAALDKEIAALRAESQSEAKAETERLAAHTAAEIAKIQAHAEQEIAAAAKAARMDLRRYSAELAVDLAEKKISSAMTPATEDSLVRDFVRELR